MCVYLLSMLTSKHCAEHLKDGKIWSMLKVVPLLHNEPMERCLIHLMYMGFGIFLKLRWRPPITLLVIINLSSPAPALGTIHSDYPNTPDQLIKESECNPEASSFIK